MDAKNRMKTRDQRCFTKQTARRPSKRPKMPFFVPGDLELWPWPSNLSERWIKHVFRVNLAQIHSAVPRDISYTNKKNHRLTALKQNLPQFTACGNKMTKPKPTYRYLYLLNSRFPAESVLAHPSPNILLPLVAMRTFKHRAQTF